MGKRGPVKEPAALKMAKGTYRADRDALPAMPHGEPAAPQWLSVESREVWEIVLGELRTVDGLLARVDAFALARYCDDWVQYWAASRIIAASGMVSVSDNGAEYQHPAVGIRNKAADRMSRFEARFGMTPSDRSGLHVASSTPAGVRTRQRA